jgi:hypothetical protein
MLTTQRRCVACADQRVQRRRRLVVARVREQMLLAPVRRQVPGQVPGQVDEADRERNHQHGLHDGVLEEELVCPGLLRHAVLDEPGTGADGGRGEQDGERHATFARGEQIGQARGSRGRAGHGFGLRGSNMRRHRDNRGPAGWCPQLVGRIRLDADVEPSCETTQTPNKICVWRLRSVRFLPASPPPALPNRRPARPRQRRGVKWLDLDVLRPGSQRQPAARSLPCGSIATMSHLM